MNLECFRRLPIRTFVLYPLLALLWELVLHRGNLRLTVPLTPIGLLLMLMGYFFYRVATEYRVAQGGGERGETWRAPPERLITTGPYSYTRNPVYVGHLLFLVGVALALRSELATIISLVTAVSLHFRVLRDEHRLATLFGRTYQEYKDRVKRWIPGLFF